MPGPPRVCVFTSCVSGRGLKIGAVCVCQHSHSRKEKEVRMREQNNGQRPAGFNGDPASLARDNMYSDASLRGIQIGIPQAKLDVHQMSLVGILNLRVLAMG